MWCHMSASLLICGLHRHWIHTYISLTGHWINGNWECKEGCFHAQPFNERQTGEHIKSIVTQCVKKWQLAEKLHLVLRGNGRNFVVGLRDANITNVGRLAHTLQLVVNEGVMAQRQVQEVLGCCYRIVGTSSIPVSLGMLFLLLRRSLMCPWPSTGRADSMEFFLLHAVWAKTSSPCHLYRCKLTFWVDVLPMAAHREIALCPTALGRGYQGSSVPDSLDFHCHTHCEYSNSAVREGMWRQGGSVERN